MWGENWQSDNSSTGSLVSCAITVRNNCNTEFNLQIWSGMATVTRQYLAPSRNANRHTTSKRGLVTTFTRKSRKRMIERMAKKADWTRPLFITLTYPDEVWFERKLTLRDFNNHLTSFFKRIEREFEGIGLIWRKEFVDRKSGAYEGEIAPHAHILVDGILHDMGHVRRFVRQAWYGVITNEMCDLPKSPRTDVQVLKGKRHATYYVSKYAAKHDDGMSDVIEEYFAAQAGDIGRHWGVRGKWDEPIYASVPLTREEYLALRRYARNFHRKAGRWQLVMNLRNASLLGFSVFWGADEVLIWQLLKHIKTRLAAF